MRATTGLGPESPVFEVSRTCSSRARDKRRRACQNLVVDLFAGPPSSVRMPQRDRYDLDIGAEHTLDRKPAIDHSLMRGRGEKMLAGCGSRDAAARLVRGNQHIGERPIEERARDRKRHQFRFGAGGREDCCRAGNSERAQDARADRVEPVVHGKRRRSQQRGERLRGGAIAGKTGGRSGRGREPDFMWGRRDRRAVAIAPGHRIGPDALVAAARQHEFELQGETAPARAIGDIVLWRRGNPCRRALLQSHPPCPDWYRGAAVSVMRRHLPSEDCRSCR